MKKIIFFSPIISYNQDFQSLFVFCRHISKSFLNSKEKITTLIQFYITGEIKNKYHNVTQKWNGSVAFEKFSSVTHDLTLSFFYRCLLNLGVLFFLPLGLVIFKTHWPSSLDPPSLCCTQMLEGWRRLNNNFSHFHSLLRSQIFPLQTKSVQTSCRRI